MQNNWYQKSIDETLTGLKTNSDGLSSSEVAKRLKEFGPNAFKTIKGRGYLKIFMSQLTSSFMIVLVVASIIVFILGEYIDGIVISSVILLNAIIGTIQEGKAEKTLIALEQKLRGTVRVRRGGGIVTIQEHQLVPGDIMIMQGGDSVFADARLISSTNVEIDEASLTGESYSVKKDALSVHSDDLTYADQENMIFRGTNVTSGLLEAVVTDTGGNTVIGHMSEELQEIDIEDIPLRRSLRKISKIILYVVAVTLVAIAIMAYYRGMDINELVITLIALGVSAIPESLPVVLTVILAAGVWRMSVNNALVKDLYAVEALGQATVLALDKTGTITKNEMMVQEVYINNSKYEVTGDGYDPVGDILLNGDRVNASSDDAISLAARTLALSSVSDIAKDPSGKSWKLVSGDPTEGAMVVFAKKLGINRNNLENSYSNLGELPFDLDAKYHASLHKIDKENMISVSGSPEVILGLSSKMHKEDGEVELGDSEREEIHSLIKELSNSGKRILAFGHRKIDKEVISHDDMNNLVFMGLVAISDAIRPEAHKAIDDAKKAGLHVVMITGDHQDTAKSIAIDVDIYKEGDHIITGKELLKLSDEELISKLGNTSVFARVSPEQKMKIVDLYKKKGDILAMTGDGINDALSLKAAHLGVAMGHIGTDSAKQAADVVLLDDNFATITKAILEGRNVYQTIRKTLTYLLSTNAGEMMTIGAALVIGLPLPLLATQIVWLNLVTDTFLVVGLSLDPKNKETLTRTRTPKKYTLMYGRDWFRTLLTASVMASVAILFFIFNLRVSIEYALTMSLCLLAIMQWYIIFNVRSEKRSILAMSKMNWYLIGSLLVTLLLQAIVVYVPFMQEIFHTMAIGLKDWIIIFILGLSVILIEEIRKLFVWMIDR